MSHKAYLRIKDAVLLLLWLSIVLGGFWRLYTYANDPSVSAVPRSHWPEISEISPTEGKATLLLFLHPQCPCSESTVAELERLLPHLSDKAHVIAVFINLDSENESWAKSRLWKKTSTLPGVEVIADINGKEALNFGAMTSGQTFLYGKNQELVFHGGITPSRGHQGDNIGKESILHFFATGKPTAATSSVFGCALKNSKTLPPKEEG